MDLRGNFPEPEGWQTAMAVVGGIIGAIGFVLYLQPESFGDFVGACVGGFVLGVTVGYIVSFFIVLLPVLLLLALIYGLYQYFWQTLAVAGSVGFVCLVVWGVYSIYKNRHSGIPTFESSQGEQQAYIGNAVIEGGVPETVKDHSGFLRRENGAILPDPYETSAENSSEVTISEEVGSRSSKSSSATLQKISPKLSVSIISSLTQEWTPGWTE